MAAAIRAAEWLPDQFARDYETGDVLGPNRKADQWRIGRLAIQRLTVSLNASDSSMNG